MAGIVWLNLTFTSFCPCGQWNSNCEAGVGEALCSMYNCKGCSHRCSLQIPCNEWARQPPSTLKKILPIILSLFLKYFALLPMPPHSKTTFSFPSLLLIHLQLHLCFFPKLSNNFLLLHATYHPTSLMIVGPSWELWSGMKVATSLNVVCSPSFFVMGIPWGYICHFGQISI